MPEKKPYSPPQFVQVELNHEQAILSTCHAATASLNQSASPGFCRTAPAPACKRRNLNTGSNSTGRPS
jgi:hypothetical protein